MAVNDAGDELIFTFAAMDFVQDDPNHGGHIVENRQWTPAPDSIPAIIAQKTEMRQDPQLIQKDCIWFTLPMNRKNTSFAALVQKRKRKLVFLFSQAKQGWFLANSQFFP